jgi:leader peptidase (prepilin peptidase)/N-methyltransferase
VIVLYVFALPHLQARGNPRLDPADLVLPRAIDVIVASWCLWVGSSVGSFLNVVAWRMPRGEGINGRSHCPRCRVQLRARDNLPVFGWLALGGRCHQCRLPISIRYPIVEAVVGLTVTAICLGQLYQFSLPRTSLLVPGGPLRAPMADSDVIITLLYHSLAVCASWACGLILLDEHRLPSRLLAGVLAVVLLPILAYPTLMTVPWQMQVSPIWRPDGQYLDAVARVISSLATATVLGRYLSQSLCPGADPKLDPLGRSTGRLMDLIVVLAIPGIVVGWQALIAVTVVGSMIAVVLQRLIRPEREALGRFAIAIPLMMTIHIVAWRHLSSPSLNRDDEIGTWLWPSAGGSPWVVLVWLLFAAMIPWWLKDPSFEHSSSALEGAGESSSLLVRSATDDFEDEADKKELSSGQEEHSQTHSP